MFTDGVELNVVASAFTPKSWVYKVAWLLVVSYGHRTLKARLPVRSALVKQCIARLVLWWVTTWESLVL
jgi:hypothetical protein